MSADDFEIEALPDDLRDIMQCVFDLAIYRRLSAAAGLSRAVAHELADRARHLPDHDRQDPDD